MQSAVSFLVFLAVALVAADDKNEGNTRFGPGGLAVPVGIQGGHAGGFPGGHAGGFPGGNAGGFPGGHAGGFPGGAGGFPGGHSGGFPGGHAGGLQGGAGGFPGGHAGGFPGGHVGGLQGGHSGGLQGGFPGGHSGGFPGGVGGGCPPVAPPRPVCKFYERNHCGHYVCSVDQKPFECPPVRPQCPGIRFGPQVCYTDNDCVGSDKCCRDACLDHLTCKGHSSGVLY